MSREPNRGRTQQGVPAGEQDWGQAIHSLRRGEAWAYSAIASHVRRTLRGIDYGDLGDYQDDLVQEVVIALLRDSARERSSAAAGAWIRTVTSRKYIDVFRRERGRRRVRDEAIGHGWRRLVRFDEGQHGGAVEPIPDATMARESLARALRQLEPSLRRSVELRYLQESTLVETAATLGVSRSTAQRMLTKARGRLRALLRQGTVGNEAFAVTS